MSFPMHDRNGHTLQRGQKVVIDPNIMCINPQDRTLGNVEIMELSNIGIPIQPGNPQLFRSVKLKIEYTMFLPAEMTLVPVFVTHDPPPVPAEAEVAVQKEAPPPSNLVTMK
jgi:hypothetical protein